MKKHYLFIATAFMSLTSLAQNRTAFVETFTSSTCGPCVGGNINIESVFDDVQNDDKFVSLKYQMSWPGNGDPYFTEEGEIRRDVYGINGVPNTRLDGGDGVGFTDGISTSSFAQSHLNASYNNPAKANITATYQVDEVAKTVAIEVDVEVLENTNPGVRIYLAIFEYSTQNNTGGNGETSFEHVMKKMIPSASGTVMPPMTAGEVYHFEYTYQFNGNYVLPANALSPTDHATEHSVEEFSDLGVAAWVQTLSTREVYNAGYAEPGIVANVSEEVNTIASAKIYPNPATDNALVAIQTLENQDVKIEVVNMMGQIVSTLTKENVEAGRTTHNLDVSSLTSGMYTVRISSANGVVSKRLSIQ